MGEDQVEALLSSWANSVSKFQWSPKQAKWSARGLPAKIATGRRGLTSYINFCAGRSTRLHVIHGITSELLCWKHHRRYRDCQQPLLLLLAPTREADW